MPLLSNLLRGEPRLEAAAVDDSAHLTPGLSGEPVRRIQIALNQLDEAGLAVDGSYGPATAAAVLRFKTKRNIVNRAYQSAPDSIVGRMTIAAMDAELAAGPTPPSKAVKPTVEIGRRFGGPPSGVRASAVAAPTHPTLEAVVRGNPHEPLFPRRVAGLPPSVPPGARSFVPITVSPALTGDDVIEIFVVNNGFVNGLATVQPETIQTTDLVMLTGVIQTEPGFAGRLQIEARFKGEVVARSNGFSVCAHPVSLSTRFYQSIDDEIQLGMLVVEELPSEFGPNLLLNQVEWCEIVEEITRNNPPFPDGNRNTSGWKSCLPPPEFNTIGDRHAEPRPDAGPEGETLKVQAHMYTCKRCGATEIPLPQSGFQIKHTVKRNKARAFEHQVAKTPLDGAGGRSPFTGKTIVSTPGIGQAVSPPRPAGPKT